VWITSLLLVEEVGVVIMAAGVVLVDLEQVQGFL